MVEPRVQRRLAAILAADVVGYSRLMEIDEAGTLVRLKLLRREIVDPAIAAHAGRMVKLMGDGALVEFASAVDAVTCAIEIQKSVRKHNASGPEDKWIQFRIGINVGDIIVEGEDIYGAFKLLVHTGGGSLCGSPFFVAPFSSIGQQRWLERYRDG
jgi:class 3 adenylate cyclase